MLDDIATYLVREWRVIADAPATIIMINLILGLVIWAVINWSYSSRFASKDAQIELQDRQLADYKQKLDGASPGEARARIESLESQLSLLVAQVEPRHLTEHQKSILTSKARISERVPTQVFIIHDLACSDCNRYAAEIANAIRASSGWAVDESGILGTRIKVACGVAMCVRSDDELAPEALILQGAFSDAGIEFETVCGDAGPPVEGLSLLITARIGRPAS